MTDEHNDADGPERRAVSLRAGSATSAGRVRAQNQDRSLIIDQALYIVADGMGGHVGGEVAAQVTVDTLAGLTGLAGGDGLRTDDVIARVEAANLAVLAQADLDPDLRGMGTTVTGLALVEGDDTSPALLLVLNVGDSRTYWLRSGELEQLTDDHSVVGELLREGKLSKADARTHRSRSVLTRALGVEPDVECDVVEVVPIVGDRFLICSDGLPTELTDPLIAATLRRLRDPQEAASALVREAVDHGGRDNVTVIVVDVTTGLDGHEVTATASAPTAVVVTGSSESASPVMRQRVTTSNQTRRPWIVNIRVLMFSALLAAIVAVVVWTLRNDPAKDPVVDTTVITPTTSVVTSTPGATDALSTGAPTTAARPTLAGGSVATATNGSADSALVDIAVVDNAADPVPGAVVDPFAPTTTKPTTATTRKRGST